MPRITYVEANGREHVVDAPTGQTVMEAAVSRSVPGIDADCGGACACATCHVYVDPAWRDRLPAPEDLEQSMLEFANEVQDSSRLSCQLKITDQLEGLIVRLPTSQR